MHYFDYFHEPAQIIKPNVLPNGNKDPQGLVRFNFKVKKGFIGKLLLNEACFEKKHMVHSMALDMDYIRLRCHQLIVFCSSILYGKG